MHHNLIQDIRIATVMRRAAHSASRSALQEFEQLVLNVRLRNWCRGRVGRSRRTSDRLRLLRCVHFGFQIHWDGRCVDVIVGFDVDANREGNSENV